MWDENGNWMPVEAAGWMPGYSGSPGYGGPGFGGPGYGRPPGYHKYPHHKHPWWQYFYPRRRRRHYHKHDMYDHRRGY